MTKYHDILDFGNEIHIGIEDYQINQFIGGHLTNTYLSPTTIDSQLNPNQLLSEDILSELDSLLNDDNEVSYRASAKLAHDFISDLNNLFANPPAPNLGLTGFGGIVLEWHAPGGVFAINIPSSGDKNLGSWIYDHSDGNVFCKGTLNATLIEPMLTHWLYNRDYDAGQSPDRQGSFGESNRAH